MGGTLIFTYKMELFSIDCWMSRAYYCCTRTQTHDNKIHSILYGHRGQVINVITYRSIHDCILHDWLYHSPPTFSTNWPNVTVCLKFVFLYESFRLCSFQRGGYLVIYLTSSSVINYMKPNNFLFRFVFIFYFLFSSRLGGIW